MTGALRILFASLCLLSSLALGESLCRLDFQAQCEPVSPVTNLSENHRQLFRTWSKRYSRLGETGEAVVLALSDLPQAIRHVIFNESGRLLSRAQVKVRVKSLGGDPEHHPVWKTLLNVMADAFGGERKFYDGLELAIHRLIVSDPGRLAALRRDMASTETLSPSEAETKTPREPQASVPRLPEKDQAG